MAVKQAISFRLEHGGTGFGHMHKRIAGYSAYDGYIYAYSRAPISARFAADKKVFIAALRKHITQRADADIRINEAKPEDKAQILDKAKTLSHLLTNNYYLQKAEEFSQPPNKLFSYSPKLPQIEKPTNTTVVSNYLQALTK